MGQVLEEVRQWNTPLIGAYLLWRFTQGFCNSHPTGEAPVAIFHFLAIGVLTNYQMIDFISNSRTDLQAYIRGFDEKKRTDILIGLQNHIHKKKLYTLEAIEIAIASGLLAWDTTQGKLYPKELTKSPKRGNTLKASIKLYGNKAEILGNWFSQYDVTTVATYLEVVL